MDGEMLTELKTSIVNLIKHANEAQCRAIMRLLMQNDDETGEQDDVETPRRRGRPRTHLKGLSTVISKHFKSIANAEQTPEEIHTKLMADGEISRTMTVDSISRELRRQTRTYTQGVNGKWRLKRYKPPALKVAS